MLIKSLSAAVIATSLLSTANTAKAESNEAKVFQLDVLDIKEKPKTEDLSNKSLDELKQKRQELEEEINNKKTVVGDVENSHADVSNKITSSSDKLEEISKQEKSIKKEKETKEDEVSSQIKGQTSLIDLFVNTEEIVNNSVETNPELKTLTNKHKEVSTQKEEAKQEVNELEIRQEALQTEIKELHSQLQKTEKEKEETDKIIQQKENEEAQAEQKRQEEERAKQEEERKKQQTQTSSTATRTTTSSTSSTQTSSVPSYSPSSFSGSSHDAFAEIVAEKGISKEEQDMWAYIINRESGWNHTATNPSSGAYGLAQSLPASKMASHGADYLTNPKTQLAWMYDYMASRYGGISGAYNFWITNHWY